MHKLELTVEQDYVLTLAKLKHPIIAVEELVWNSLDADATKVRVDVVMNNQGGLARIKVTDNGSGIRPQDCDHAFSTLGGSPKARMQTTPDGRVPHGKQGKGRFKAFGIGPKVTWTSRYRDNGSVKQFDVTAKRSSLTTFTVSDEKDCSTKTTGVVVTIDGIEQNFKQLLDADKAAEELSKRLALYLRRYPDIDIQYDGVPVDPSKFERLCETYDVVLKNAEGEDVPGQVTVIEWTSTVDRALYLCDSAGFALDQTKPSIHAPGYDFTAYVKSDLLTQLNEDGALGLEELHPVVKGVVDTARETLKTHFRQREKSLASDLVKQWQAEKVYPYAPHEHDPVKQVEREVFDVCAVKVHDYLPSFEASDPKSKRLTFRLLKQALEHNADSLQTILRQVLELPQAQQDDLAKILERTKLAAVINAAKTVVDRLDFISSMDALLYGEHKERLKERSQLHRILADEVWLFGEQYTLAVDDQSLTEVLRKHVQLLGRTDLAPADLASVTDLDGTVRIVDMMLCKSVPQTQPHEFEHLVVELKRPKCHLGQDEIGQIENYALTIGRDERFKNSRARWKFVLLGNDLTEFGEEKCKAQGDEVGLIYRSKDGRIGIYVRTWASILEEAKWRYGFFKKQLELEVTTADGLAYLREKHSERLPTDVSPAPAK